MTVSEKTRGEHVARELGWPPKEHGIVGAAGGLIDPASFRFHMPRPALVLVNEYNRRSAQAIQRRIQETATSLLRLG